MTVVDEGYVAAVEKRLEVVRRRIASAGADPKRVRVVAVTKGFDLAAVLAAQSLGCLDIGENYADELVEKASSCSHLLPAPRWHFLGAVQRNKVSRLAPFVSLYESLDRIEEGEAIAARAPGAAVLVEVNTSGSQVRGGVVPEAVGQLVHALSRLGLDVRGLMTVAPQHDRERALAGFGAVASLVASLGLGEASMGMSDDLELAVATGATMVRLGRALFGPRPEKLPPKSSGEDDARRAVGPVPQ